MEEKFYHFINNDKIEGNHFAYRDLILELTTKNNKTNNHLPNIIDNSLIYLENEIRKVNAKYQLITVCEKYSEYVNYVLLKNKNIPKKKFKTILTDLYEQIEEREGGDLVNIQFKDMNLLIYIFNNKTVEKL